MGWKYILIWNHLDRHAACELGPPEPNSGGRTVRGVRQLIGDLQGNVNYSESWQHRARLPVVLWRASPHQERGVGCETHAKSTHFASVSHVIPLFWNTTTVLSRNFLQHFRHYTMLDPGCCSGPLPYSEHSAPLPSHDTVHQTATPPRTTQCA